MSDREKTTISLILGILSLAATIFFGLRTEGLLRFEEWTWEWNINKSFSLIGSIISILSLISTFTFHKRNNQVVEAERKAKEEAERKAKEEAEQKAKEEAEQKAKEEAERKAKEEAERKAKEEAERKAKEEAERIALEKEKKKKKNNDGMVRIGTSFLASIVSFEGGKYLVSVKYCGDSSIMVKEVKMLEGDICSISNVNELKNIYLTDGRGFDVQLKRNTYSEEHKSCILIQCDYPEKIMFDVNTAKILNGTNERDKV